jgi:gamma-glutamylcyclotransferase
MYYFAYASNLNKKQMQERCPDAKPKFVAVLPNYKLIFSGWSRQWHGGTAAIKSFRGEKVRGAIYEISDASMRVLDKFEGINEGTHTRFNVTVFDEDNQPVQAVTYIKTGQLEETLPSKEYGAVIHQGYRDWRIV